MKICLDSYDGSLETPEDAWLNLIQRIEQVSCNLHIFPELATSGYQWEKLALFARLAKGFVNHLLPVAKKHKKVIVIGTFWKSNTKKFYNRLLWVDGIQNKIDFYDKMHLIDAFQEKEYLQAGQSPKQVFFQNIPIGLSICYDLRFPELFRKYVSKSPAEILLCIARWPKERIEHWKALALARAIENQTFFVGVNANHSSLVVNPKGEILCIQKKPNEQIIQEISLQEVPKWRNAFPVLSDIRKDLCK
ncbi:MAG: hypothetical protein D6767_07565 [Candidatus Hydrogenedentota bacterium]|nr:MAG: hypothetical protein D6767_07565 [Candidatus Hydrogenedentota bacterium]